MIDRRTFLHGIAWLVLPNVGRPQPAERMRRIGVLSAFPRGDLDASMKAMRSELEKLGWIEGRTITLLEPRTSEGRNDRLLTFASQVVALAPDVIVVYSAPATRALMQATATIPIVMQAVGDPVAYSIVRSYIEPGGNVTGNRFELPRERILPEDA